MFEPVVAYVAFCPGQEVEWSFDDLEDPIFLYCWFMGKLIGLADKRVHGLRRDIDGRLVCRKHCLLFHAVLFKPSVLLSNLDAAVMATRATFGDEHSDPTPGGVVVPVQW